MNHTPKIGAFVLETLTTGMYTNPLDSIREYIQNAFDSILSAERFKFLDRNEGIIIISIDPESRSLSIKDNGTGLSSSEVIPRLLNIGMSSKQYGQEAGFRGIGRLAGMAYSKKVKFVTSYKYEDDSSIIEFDCEGIRKSISPSLKQVEELADVLKKNTTQDLSDAKKDDHFFEVRLEGLDETVPNFLNLNQLEDYLCQVAPVEYDAQSFVFATKIEKWMSDHGLCIPYIKLILRDLSKGTERQVFKPYKTHYQTKRSNYEIEVKDIDFYPDNLKETPNFCMWYSKTDLLGMFDDTKVAGLRFRRDNIAIDGPERVAEIFPGNEGRLNYWTIGEIHIFSNEIIPNARRDGFESTPAWEALKVDLSPFITNHCKACHDASSTKGRPTVKIISSAEATIKAAKKALKIGLASNEEREELIKKLQKETERVAKASDTKVKPEEKQQLTSTLTSLKALQERLDEENAFAIKKIKSSLDRKQRRILVELLEIVSEVLSKTNCPKKRECLEAIKKSIVTKYKAS